VGGDALGHLAVDELRRRDEPRALRAGHQFERAPPRISAARVSSRPVPVRPRDRRRRARQGASGRRRRSCMKSCSHP
jgi:hypothetical protein